MRDIQLQVSAAGAAIEVHAGQQTVVTLDPVAPAVTHLELAAVRSIALSAAVLSEAI